MFTLYNIREVRCKHSAQDRVTTVQTNQTSIKQPDVFHVTTFLVFALVPVGLKFCSQHEQNDPGQQSLIANKQHLVPTPCQKKFFVCWSQDGGTGS